MRAVPPAAGTLPGMVKMVLLTWIVSALALDMEWRLCLMRRWHRSAFRSLLPDQSGLV
jgi:hypothetical protein